VMKPSHSVRIALVGCGAISELYYAPALAALRSGSAEVSAVFDPDADRAAKLARLLPGAGVTTDFAEVLGRRPDLAIVASPPRFHAQQTIALLEAGIGVLCEKPMAVTVAEADAMIAAAARSPGPLAIGLFRRFFPVNRTIRDIVRGQHLGVVKRFEISEGGPFQWPAQSPSFFQKSGSHGGVLADPGVHVLIWWFGVPESIRYEDDAMGGLEANCRIELGFPGGIAGTVRLSRDTQLPNRTVIECERGWLRCKAVAADRLELGFPGSDHAFGGELVCVGPAGANSLRPLAADTYDHSFMRQLMNVIAAVRGTESVFIPPAEGAPSVRVIEQCYRQRGLMPMPWLDPAESVRARALAAEGTSP